MEDLLVLIDKLDDHIHKARPVPLTDQVRVDKEEIYDLLDRMRAAVPELVQSSPAGGFDQEALNRAVAEAIRENIPAIAQAVAAATEGRSGPAPSEPRPPGAPF